MHHNVSNSKETYKVTLQFLPRKSQETSYKYCVYYLLET